MKLTNYCVTSVFFWCPLQDSISTIFFAGFFCTWHDPGTVTIPQYRFNKTKQHTHTHATRDVITVLLIFAKYLLLYLYIFICTYRATHTRAHINNQYTKKIPQLATGVWLRLVEERLLLETKVCTHTKKRGRKKKGEKCQEKLIFTNLKKRIRAHRASSKVTRLFLTK